MLPRAAEILLFRLLQVEFAISPGGVLREWVKLCLRILLLLLIPACLLVPPVVLIAVGLADLAQEIARMCAEALKAVMAITAAVAIGALLLSWLVSNRK
jgi:hypothetical protein